MYLIGVVEMPHGSGSVENVLVVVKLYCTLDTAVCVIHISKSLV